MVRQAGRRFDLYTVRWLAPAVVALLGAGLALLLGNLRAGYWPFDVAGVLLAIGVVATLLAGKQPLRAALFVALLIAFVLTVLYGSY